MGNLGIGATFVAFLLLSNLVEYLNTRRMTPEERKRYDADIDEQLTYW